MKHQILSIFLILSLNVFTQNNIKYLSSDNLSQAIGYKSLNDDYKISVVNETQNGSTDIVINKHDDNNNIVWSKKYDLNNNSNDFAFDFMIDGDKNIVVVGGYNPNFSFMLKVESNQGTILFSKSITNASNGLQNKILRIYQMNKNNSDDYIFLGMSNNPYTHFIGRMSKDGVVKWAKEQDISGGNELTYSLTESSDGDIILAGALSNGSIFDSGILTFNPDNGNLLKIRKYDFSLGSYFNSGFDNICNIEGTDLIALSVVVNSGYSDPTFQGIAIYNTKKDTLERIQLYKVLNGNATRGSSIKYIPNLNKFVIGTFHKQRNEINMLFQIIDNNDLKNTAYYQFKEIDNTKHTSGPAYVDVTKNNEILVAGYLSESTNKAKSKAIISNISLSELSCLNVLSHELNTIKVPKHTTSILTFVKNIQLNNINTTVASFSYNVSLICGQTCDTKTKLFNLSALKNKDTICVNSLYQLKIDIINNTNDSPAVISLYKQNGNSLTLLNFLKSKKQVTFDFNTNEEDENFIVIGTMKCSKNDTLYLNLKKRPRANYTINSFEPYFCSGDSIKLNAINQSSTKALSFSWTDSLTGEILGNTETIQYFPKQSTTILLNISDNCSNPILLKSKIWVVPELNNTSLIGLKSGCEPFRTILNIPSSKSSTIVTPFLWELYINNSKQQTINTESGKTESPIPLTFDNEGVYPLLLQQKISEDKTCVVLSDTITVHPQAKADFQASSYDLIISNPIVSIDNKSIKANQYLWFISDTTNYQTTDIQHQFKRTGSFDVTLIAQNEHNCNDTISKIIKVHSPYSILIPNSFSPNKDGLNETWKPQIESLKEAELIIFNRWGEILVKYTGNQLEWDGTFKGEICQEGIYYYQIAVKSFEKKAYYYKGFIYLK